MKKIVIISYYSKPSNFVGAERIKGWLDHFPKKDVYPVLITRFWKKNQDNNENFHSYKKNKIEKYGSYETHRVISKESLRELLIRKNKMRLLRKILSFTQLIFNNLFFIKSQYYTLFEYTDRFLHENIDFDTVIISGTPFHTFSLGYYLKKKHPKINWHPDYRDQWTTHPFKSKLNLIEKFIFCLERRNELKWTSNCTSFITVSEDWRNRIKSKIGKPGFVVKNGLSIEVDQILEQEVPRKKDELVISYIGSMYPYQNFEKLLSAVEFLYKTKQIKIKINFIGIDTYHNISPKIKKISHDYSELITISKRIAPDELEQIYTKSDLLWLTSFGEMKGWYPVKLFEYASKGIPILLYPTDNDVIEKFLLKTKTGYSFKNLLELAKWLESIFKGKNIKQTINKTELKKHTREYQTKKLFDILISKT